MALKHRLQKLEGGSRRPCPNCGEYSSNDSSVEHEIVVEWYDDPDNQPTQEPTICPTCGESDFIIIRWLDLEEDWYPDED
jgi:ribosomal protein S27AE